VLLDYSLPGRNGVEVLKSLRAGHPFVPVVMLTGQGSESVAVTAMREGAQNYIAKAAITPQALQHALRVAIDHCAMENRIHEQRASLEIFTRALAHDLKEPVRTITSFLDLLCATERFSEKGRGYYAFIRGATERMAALIEAVYLYTRLDGSAPQIAKESCDLGAVLEDVMADLGELIRERKAAIRTASLPAVPGDRRQLAQLLQNLLCNAIHHCPGAPVIRIDAVESEEHWAVRVADNGPGIEPAQRERVFEPFKRLAHSKGLGLGLAICKRIVEAHGGRIRCETGSDGGAAFIFTLPKQDAARKGARDAEAVESVRAADEPLALANVLLVDDSEGDIALTRILLLEKSKLRCNLLVARDGHAAKRMLEQTDRAGSVDLLLLDINLPGMDGFELLESLRANPALRHLPVVMCSTSSYDRDMERARGLGALGYIEKPMAFGKLRPLLERAADLDLLDESEGHVLRRAATA
jgi:signal transduction histidine kinase